MIRNPRMNDPLSHTVIGSVVVPPSAPGEPARIGLGESVFYARVAKGVGTLTTFQRVTLVRFGGPVSGTYLVTGIVADLPTLDTTDTTTTTGG